MQKRYTIQISHSDRMAQQMMNLVDRARIGLSSQKVASPQKKKQKLHERWMLDWAHDHHIVLSQVRASQQQRLPMPLSSGEIPPLRCIVRKAKPLRALGKGKWMLKLLGNGRAEMEYSHPVTGKRMRKTLRVLSLEKEVTKPTAQI